MHKWKYKLQYMQEYKQYYCNWYLQQNIHNTNMFKLFLWYLIEKKFLYRCKNKNPNIYIMHPMETSKKLQKDSRAKNIHATENYGHG